MLPTTTKGALVKKQELKDLVTEYGDAVITYRSAKSKKLKYNVCTLDFSTPYIKQKRNRAKESWDTLLLYCWDRLLRPESIVSVVPLSSILKNER